MADARPIGLFDSGVGGLTVLREVLRRLPAESTLYLGDNLRAPYGPRPDAEVRVFSLECIDELVARGVKAVVVACNTTSAVALPDARRRYDVPILGVVRPGAAAAALATRNRHVGVIATPATVRSHAYFHAIKDENPAVEVYEHATPELVPLVEAGKLDGDETRAAVRRSLAPLFGATSGNGTDGGRGDTSLGNPSSSSQSPNGEFVFPLPPSDRIDTLLLGCTHYPLLAPLIRAEVGPEVAVIDSAPATASALAELLDVNSLAAPAGNRAEHSQLTTGDVAAFRRTAERLFGDVFPSVAAVGVAGPP